LWDFVPQITPEPPFFWELSAQSGPTQSPCPPNPDAYNPISVL
jgi:hypothetical protein